MQTLSACSRRTAARVATAAALFTLASACGKESNAKAEAEGDAENLPAQAKNAIEAVGQLAKATSTFETANAEAAKFQADRKTRGDTISMSYTALQAFLPDAPPGYKKSDEVGGSSQRMSGWSMTDADQDYYLEGAPDGTRPTIHVKLVDFGGTQTGYGILAMPMMIDMQQEDAHSRTATVKLGPAFTWAREEFDKDNKDAKMMAVTRYRYLIEVEAMGHGTDLMPLVKSLTENVVRKFEGK
jgi:hypothetical protein